MKSFNLFCFVHLQKAESVLTVQQLQRLSGEEMVTATTYVMHVAFITK